MRLRWTGRAGLVLEASLGRLLFRIAPDGLLERLTVLRRRDEVAQHEGETFALFDCIHSERCVGIVQAGNAARSWLRTNSELA